MTTSFVKPSHQLALLMKTTFLLKNGYELVFSPKATENQAPYYGEIVDSLTGRLEIGGINAENMTAESALDDLYVCLLNEPEGSEIFKDLQFVISLF